MIPIYKREILDNPNDAKWFIEHIRYRYKRRLFFKITGQYDDEVMDSFLEDVLNYKWLECEKAGCNLFSGSEEEQVIQAGKDFLKKNATEANNSNLHTQ